MDCMTKSLPSLVFEDPFMKDKSDKVVLPSVAQLLSPPTESQTWKAGRTPYFLFTIPPVSLESLNRESCEKKRSSPNDEGLEPPHKLLKVFPEARKAVRPCIEPISIAIKALSPVIHSHGSQENFKQKYGNLFELAQQPHFKQRKTYQHTIRYLQPNPLQITKRMPRNEETLPTVTNGNVEVSLVSEDGRELPEVYQALLRCKYSSLRQPITVQDKSKFSLMLMETSDGKLFKLKFKINYEAEENGVLYSVEEVVYSCAFHVDCNQRSPKEYLKPDEPQPVVASKPTEGHAEKRSLDWSKVLKLLDAGNARNA